ncbi:hypothetical protein [Friedmanniella luteola]|nr:hypothetical protein [Friedmanniella luteola]
MTQHALGTDGSCTAERRPVELVWTHESDRIDEAYGLERKIQG